MRVLQIILSFMILFISYKDSQGPIFAIALVLTFLLLFDSLDDFFKIIANSFNKNKAAKDKKWWLNA